MKKILFSIVALLMLVTMIGCGGNDYDFDSRFNQILSDVNPNAVTKDIDLVKSSGKLSIEWVSSNPEILSNDGKVMNTTGEDVTVVLTAHMKYGNEEETKTITLVIKSVSYDKIIDAYSANVGDLFEFAAQVVGVGAKGFLIRDNSGCLYVHTNGSHNVALGDKVLIKGNLAEYNGTKQFNDTCNYTVMSKGEVSLGNPKVLTGSEVDSFVQKGFTPELVKVTGVLNISEDKYYNITIPGATVKGSIQYPLYPAALKELANHNVEVVGFALGTASEGRYLNIMLTGDVKDLGSAISGESTIKEVFDGELGNYEVKGTVVAVNAQSFLIKDNTGIIQVYLGSSWVNDLKVGDKLKVSGPTSVYGAAKQFSGGVSYEKLGTEEVNYGDPKELTTKELDAYKSATLVNPIYVKVKGLLSVSESDDGKKTYYNLKIDGASITGSLSYPLQIDKVDQYNNHVVEILGYVTGVTGNGNYVNFTYTSIKDLGVETVTEATIKEVLDAEAGKYLVKGTVVATNARSFLIKDSTGLILVYKGGNWSQDLKVGDKVTVEGSTAVFGGAKQFDASCKYQKTGSELVTYEEAKELTIDELNAYANATTVTPLYVKVVGELSVSDSKYYNINISGSSVIGSYTYPIDVNAVTALAGKTIEVYGYVTGVTGSGKYLNIIVVECKEYISHTHEFNQEVVDSKYLAEAATCTAKAKYYKSCACGEFDKAETFEAGELADHKYDQEVVDAKYLESEATCTAKAKYYKSCVCGEFDKAETFEAGELVPHTYDKEVAEGKYLATPATTESPATYYKSCYCGAFDKAASETFSYGDKLPEVHTHEYNQEVADEKFLKDKATCTTAAVYYKSCICGEKGEITFVSDIFEPHTYDKEAVDNKYLVSEATCTSKAKYYKSCTCGAFDKASSEIFETGELLDHTYDKEVVEEKYLASEATTESPAKYYKSCYCGAFDKEKSETFEYGEKLPEPTKTVAEVLASELGSYKVNGVVTAINSKGFLVTDSTGSILVFLGSDYKGGLSIGDQVTVEGTTTVYGLAKQFGTGTKFTKTGTETVSYGDAKELTIEEIDAYAKAQSVSPVYVKVTGKLSVSGSYYNLMLAGSSLTGSITYPADAEEWNALDGKTLEIYGYVTGVVNSQYLNILVVDYTEVEDIIVPSEEKTIAEVIAAGNGNYIVKGTVVAFNANGFLVKDNTGMIFVYMGYDYEGDLAVGDVVTVEGTTSTYGAAKQFGQDSTYTKTGTDTVSNGTAKELTKEDLDAYMTAASITPVYAKLTAKLTTSGNYINLTFADSSIKGSIAYAVNADELKLLNNHNVEVYGYVLYYASGYLNIMLVECKDLGAEELPNPDSGVKVVVFDDVSKRTEYSTSKQVWVQNDVTIINNKDKSTSNVGDYSNPARFYKGSQLIIQSTGMQKIEFTVNSYKSSYATDLKTAIEQAGYTCTVSGNVVTVVFDEPINEFTISLTAGQVRMDSLTATCK